ncbi:putative 2-oxoglutarate dehydrogenase E1 component DHKTD1 mitochondrial [Brachionus plicatilis]|uniref:Putative 2-oxoglutarate dehydrogenase E1 component DHKTD1 mitochondrial n=1 Tax=Brachionus plicatilis TaxID=10195 RepID=A0A3M7RI10_BRAPC|nr:putative 2-oxoglutarate dehydrogenase E1 component DHKTD1 mitochondrial [Brachionus plicatilis]
MFRCSQIIKHFNHSNNKHAILANLTPKNYHYQTEIYTNKFEAFDEKLSEKLKNTNQSRNNQSNLYRFINAYRQHGYRIAKLDPLNQQNNNNKLSELDPATYGLERDSTTYPIQDLIHASDSGKLTIDEVENYLKTIYSDKISIEFEFITCPEEKLWIEQKFEEHLSRPIETQTRLDILDLLMKSQAFDHFLAEKFPSFKRYSLEGGESAMAFYHSIFSGLAKNDIEQLIMGIAHRGRLNLVTCMLNLDPVLLFAKIKGRSEYSADVTATGDISHHFPCSTDLTFDGKKIHVSLLQNPSHLEAVDPLVLGKARAKQMSSKDCLYSDDPKNISKKIASFLIHGDAAFAGQGIVSETFQLSKLPSYSVGGTIHLITNNQLGFTLPSNLGRSGHFNSDLAKGFDCPIIHVNGDDPELAYRAGQFAVEYRNKFGKDVLVDMVCFRKYGHNELDDPSFTNPLMYKTINSRETVPNMYKKILLDENLADSGSVELEVKNFESMLAEALSKVEKNNYKFEPRNTYLNGQWSDMRLSSNNERSTWNTGCSLDLLRFVGVKSVSLPDDFSVHPTVERAHVHKRLERIRDGKKIDWSTAEALAIGSLISQGYNVRISGQDVGRGTFSHRHAMLVDQKNNKTFIPLNNLDQNQKSFFEICNSFLSEEAVMGFDYGFSLDSPNNLVIWEAQFGDFFNGAQIIIDTYISSGETKWLYQSGLVLLLPHGFDGAGPEHSSCRIERFLQMSSSKEDKVDSDDINYFIANPTTPANYFHLLRRQMMMPFRKPLIVASPKNLLRLPECVSTLEEMCENKSFRPVIDDEKIDGKDSIKRVIFVFGKHFYALDNERTKRGLKDVALIRIEELSPFPAHEIRNVMQQYKNAKEFVWSQEEHRNMGAWSFVSPRFENILGIKLKYSGREAHNTIAGIGELHAKEAQYVINRPFEKF